MSLTSLLRGTRPNQKEFQAILREVLLARESFQTISGSKALSKTDYEELVPYNLEKSDNSTIIGIALDYLARIMLARVVKKNKEESYSNLIAEDGMKAISRLFKSRRTKMKIEKQLEKSITRMKKFSNNNQDIKKLILDVCFLAKLERVFRSGILPVNIYNESFFDGPDEEVINDLEQLCDVFQAKFIPMISTTSEIIYNPHFGPASAFVGGADADILVDGTLYDFKTGKRIGYRWQEIAQIFGYYLLNEISLYIKMKGINHNADNQQLDIKRIAFYRARYGEIEYVDTSDFDSQIIESAKKDLAKYFVKHPNLSRPMIENLHVLKRLAEN